jgi:hypothetical protein
MSVQAAADAARSGPSPADPSTIPALCLAYQVTGDTGYAQTAITSMLAEAVPANDLSGDDYYDYRDVMPNMTAGYDWCWDQLSSTQRTQIAGWLMDRADAVWPDTNPARACGWAVDDPADNYYYGFLMTWPAALAVYNEEPRAPTHLALGLQKFQRVRSYTDGWGTGGVFAESTNYDSTGRLGLVLDGHLTATGQDLMNTGGFTFLHDSLDWRIHGSVPTLDLYYPLGDQSRISIGPLSDYDRFRALIPTLDDADAMQRQYGKWWLDHITPNTSVWDFQSAWEFLYYDEDAPSADYTQSFATSYLTSGPGILLKRSDWSPTATYWGAWSGPLEEGHQNADVNGFMIYKGGWLAGNTTIWSQSGIWNDTLSSNNMTFGGLEQDWQTPDAAWPNPAGSIVKEEDASDYTYFAGQGAQAYVQDRSHCGVKIVNDYTRKIAYLTPDLFLILDRVSLVDPTKAKEWHLHAQNSIVVSGRSWTVDDGAYKMWGVSLLPASATTVTAVAEHAGSGMPPCDISSYRVDAVSTDTAPTDYLLNVIQLSPLAAASVPTPAAVSDTAGLMTGAQVGTQTVLFGQSELVSGPVTYTVAENAASQHLLLDLKASTSYQVAVTGGAAPENLTATSSAQGSLRFSLSSTGSLTITVTPM